MWRVTGKKKQAMACVAGSAAKILGMKAIVQRVLSASVHVDSELVSQIPGGLLTLLGVRSGDTAEDVDWLIRKIVSLRIFEDEAGKMNRSLVDQGGQHLIVSQFTLLGDSSKGNR